MSVPAASLWRDVGMSPVGQAALVLLAGAVAVVGALLPVAAMVVLAVVLAGVMGVWLYRAPERGLLLFILFLPFHIVTMAVLFGGLGLPEHLVRAVAAWKEALVLVLVGMVLLRALAGRRPELVQVIWPDVFVVMLLVLPLLFLLVPPTWLGVKVPLVAKLYGVRDASYFLVLYLVGRVVGLGRLGTTGALKLLAAVGAVTSAIGIVERLVVPEELLVVIGASRYFQDFLGWSFFSTSNAYGLPDNYWTAIGGVLIRRVASTYLSSQGFAIPFLIIIPAAAYLVFGRGGTGRRWVAVFALCWVGLLLSVTRMTILACGIQMVLLMVLLRSRGSFWTFLAGGVAAAGLLVALYPQAVEFVWRTLTFQTSSSGTHLEAWADGIDAFSRNPLGWGVGVTDQVAIRFGIPQLTGDNLYLKYLAELGLLGFAAHLLLLLTVLWGGYMVWLRSRNPDERALGFVILLATVGMALNGMTAVLYNSNMLAYTFWWLAGAGGTAFARVKLCASPST